MTAHSDAKRARQIAESDIRAVKEALRNIRVPKLTDPKTVVRQNYEARLATLQARLPVLREKLAAARAAEVASLEADVR